MDNLEQAGRGEPIQREPARASLVGRSSPFAITPTVTLDNEASDQASVLEASGRDRPGLLEALARAISEAELSIQSAHIDGHGERAVDTFYVVGRDGAKLADGSKAIRLRARLVEVLDADVRPSRLPRARASAAR